MEEENPLADPKNNDYISDGTPIYDDPNEDPKSNGMIINGVASNDPKLMERANNDYIPDE